MMVKRSRSYDADWAAKVIDIYICPIAYALPSVPVLAADGHIYERECIEKHFTIRDQSPVTNEKISHKLIEARFVYQTLQVLVDAGVKDERLQEWELHLKKNRVSTYPKGHPQHGAQCHYKNGIQVCTDFAYWHRRHGEICFFEDEKHIRTEYAVGHPKHGMISFWENNEQVYNEYTQEHVCHGQVDYFQNGIHIRTEFAKHHARNGEICFIEDVDRQKIRVEFSSNHPCHGKVCFFERNKHICTQFNTCHG